MSGRTGVLAVATVLLALASIPMLATAVAVWVALGRPVFFTQERVGLSMRPFVIRKFRTMRETRDASGALLPDHLRVTRATRWLRWIRADELPQLLSIVRGDMTFIGPRPLPRAVIETFGGLATVRCSVRPGLTGWAQVNGNAKLSGAQKLALDIWYIDNRTIFLDMWILLRTVDVMILGERIRPRSIEMAEANLALHRRNGDPSRAGVSA